MFKHPSSGQPRMLHVPVATSGTDHGRGRGKESRDPGAGSGGKLPVASGHYMVCAAQEDTQSTEAATALGLSSDQWSGLACAACY